MKPLDDKYSPNLRRWLNNRKRRSGMPQSVFRDAEGAQWIGWLDEDLYLIGSRLMGVLCNGSKEKVFAYPLSRIPKLEEITGFWSEYERVGRCAIDPEHAHYFLSRDGRYAEDGDARTCKWCGAQHVRERYVEPVPRERWVSPNALRNQGDERHSKKERLKDMTNDVDASGSRNCSDDFDEPYEYDDYGDDEPTCHTCCGEGWVESVAEESGRWGWDEDGPGKCPNCRGSGLLKDCTTF